jgi:hypothetical protein
MRPKYKAGEVIEAPSKNSSDTFQRKDVVGLRKIIVV